MKYKEILDSVLGNDCAEEKGEKEKESDVNKKTPKKQIFIRDCRCSRVGFRLITLTW